MLVYFFIIVFEVLFVKIRSEEGIKGIVVDKEIKFVVFVDDLIMFLYDVNFFENFFVFFYRFGMCFGLKFNVEKIEVLWLGICYNRD